MYQKSEINLYVTGEGINFDLYEKNGGWDVIDSGSYNSTM